MRFLLNQLPASKTTKGNYLVVDNPYNTPRFWQHWRAILLLSTHGFADLLPSI